MAKNETPTGGKFASIPFKVLADACDSLNAVLEEKELHIRTVGTKKDAIIEKFVARIGDVIAAKADNQLPADVCAFYNTYLLKVAEGARPFSSKTAKAMKVEGVEPATVVPPAEITPAPTKKGLTKKNTAPKITPAAAPAPAPAAGKSGQPKVLLRKTPAPAAPVTPTPSGKSLGLKTTGGKSLPVQNGKKSGLKSDVPPPKKDGKKGGPQRGRGNGMVARAVHLYVVDGITDTKDIAAVIDKEFPNTNNRSTIGHVRCILGNIPDGYLVKKAAPAKALSKGLSLKK